MTPDELSLPSHDINAERFTLGAMMLSPQAVAECAEVVSPGDFFRPLHREIFRSLIMMYAADEPVTPVTLAAWLSRDSVKFDPMYLFELYQQAVPAPMAAAHARLVWDHAVRRNLASMGEHIADLSGELSSDPAELLGRATQMINQMSRHASPDDGQAMTTDEFCALEGRASEPVIDGLIGHQERAIFVGGEGAGKTTALHQIGFALAAGVHPFSPEQIKPGKTLILDLENPVEILKRRLSGLRDTAAGYPGWDDANLVIFARPGGLDLTSPVQAFKLAEVIRREQPDLIVGGPIYKMLPGGEVSEWQHSTVTRFWDVIRARYDCAIALETHAPMQMSNGKRDMRPLGSGVYSRWPEFGISLARDRRDGSLTLDRFRGDREEGRSWPDKLIRNTQGGWPWSAVYPPGTFTRQIGVA